MKGYLQRLVQTVTHPAESVHPGVGSMFSAGHPGDFNVVETEEAAPVNAARPSLEVVSPGSERSSRASVPTRTLEPRAERNSLKPGLQTTQVAPGTEPSAHRATPVSERIVLKPLITNSEQTAADNVDAKELGITPAQGSETALTPRGHRSVAGEEAVVKTGRIRQVAVDSPRTHTEKDARPTRNSVALDRQTDEIQIHIGRIEVTAVHPPPPARPRARDKEISLDAYLKRRDGRAE